MTSVLRRLSDASATSLPGSGRLACGVQRVAHECFVCEGTIGLGGVEKCDATFDSRPDQRDHFLLVACRTVANAHSHTAEPESRDFQVAISKFAFLHCFSFAVFLSSPRLRSSVVEPVS